jgi:6-phosphogluconolactonase
MRTCSRSSTSKHGRCTENLIYVGTYTDRGSKGIYACRFDSKTGKLADLGLAAESAQPSFLAVDSSARFLYTANEIKNFNGLPTGAVSSFAIDSATGGLSLLNQVSSRGGGPAHIILDQTGNHAFVSNYTSGSMAAFPVLKDGRLSEVSAFAQNTGSSVNKQRQEGPHAHAVAMSRDNRSAVLADLGLDQLIVYPFDSTKGMLGQKNKIFKTNPGSGPRHLVFDHIGKIPVRA